MISRLGSALVLIGIVLMTVFLVTNSAGQGSLQLLLLGAGASALGLLLRRSRRDQRPRRFRTLRRLMGEEEESEPE